MGRNIILKTKLTEDVGFDADQALPTETPDKYVNQIVKLIPIDVVGVYLGISNLITGQYIIQWVIFLLVLIITPMYLWRVANIQDRSQIIVATVSFVVWAVSLGGPFVIFFNDKLPENFPVTTLGGILIMLYTLVVPIFYRPAK